MSLLDSQETDPVEQCYAAEQGRHVRGAIERLPEALRRAVLLVYYQGLKYREAADVLNVPVGTVKSRLHAAIVRLNESLAPA